jgi:7,8-dihydropterin-6-yl-methyl-4-(beta-D-ribofuranosyl)aminobenzene 5'-phosphate synthase
MNATISVFYLVLFLAFQIQVLCQDYKILNDPSRLASITLSNGIDKPVTVKIIYDNTSKTSAFRADWGYSIFIEGLEKNILFDLGTKPGIFISNFEKLGIDPHEVDMVVISHEHGDHTGGIEAFVKMRNDIPVLIPYSFTDSFKREMKEKGLIPVLVREPAEICGSLFTSGEFDGQIPEQALVLNTRQGLVVMTGCSHPGIVSMLRTIRSQFNKQIYMVFGGFHLLEKPDSETRSIINDIIDLGIVKCGATHCTGEKQIEMFRKAFGENFVELGAGNTLIIN